MKHPPSKADFEAWKEAPWFVQYLEDQIAHADEMTNECAKTVLICPLEHVEGLRARAMGIAGQAGNLLALQSLTYEDIVGGDDEG